MATQDRGTHLGVARVPWAKPALAYLGVLAVGVLVFGLVLRPDLVAAVPLGTGLALLVLTGVLLIPAVVATIALSHRLEATSGTARAAIGAVSWAGWGLVVAATLAFVSRLVLLPEELVADLALFAAAGAAFSILGLDGHETRAGKAVTVVSVVIVALVVLGSLLMAGRWGSPV